MALPNLEALGFKQPQPDDAIALGADAITTNAQATYRLVANDFTQRLKPQAGQTVSYSLNSDAETQAVVIEQPGLVKVNHPESIEWPQGVPNLSTKAGDVIYLAFVKLIGTRYLGFVLAGLDKTNDFFTAYTHEPLKFANLANARSGWLRAPGDEIGIYVTPGGDSATGFTYTFSNQISHVIPKGVTVDNISAWIEPTPEQIQKAGKRNENIGISTTKTFKYAQPFGVSVTKRTGSEMQFNLSGAKFSNRYYGIKIQNGNYWNYLPLGDLKVAAKPGDTIALFCDNLKFTAFLRRAGSQNWQVINEFTYTGLRNDTELKVSLSGDGEYTNTEFWERA